MDFNSEDLELVELLRDLVEIKSVNPPGLESEMMDYILNYFKSYDVNISRIPVSDKRANLIIEIPGRNEKKIVFSGHMDVVPVSKAENTRWKSEPFSADIIDGRIYGRGSADMKGGLAAVMHSMKSILKREVKPYHTIVFAATVDEENMMTGSKEIIKTDFLSNTEIAIICEPTNLEVCNIGYGRTWSELEFIGNTAHGSQKSAGNNAIEMAAELMNKMDEAEFTKIDSEGYGNSFWQPLSINAGVEPAVVPDRCKLLIDARITPEINTNRVWQDLDKMIKKIKDTNPNFKVKYEVKEKREPWITNKDDKYLKNILNIIEENGLVPKLESFKGTTDASYFRKLGMNTIIFGPGDLSIVHKENENLKIKDLILAAKIYLSIMESEI
ncbi:MAG: M20 family metallopeptidase [Tissierellia bacterium]|nr:M20 family metallopeptidase [Tissierellia bacterium]